LNVCHFLFNSVYSFEVHINYAKMEEEHSEAERRCNESIVKQPENRYHND